MSTLIKTNSNKALPGQSVSQMGSNTSVHSHRMKDEDKTLGLWSPIHFSKSCQLDGLLILAAIELHEIFL
jgi:hypothetical protein